MRFALLFLLSSCSLFFGSSDKQVSAKGREYKSHFSQARWIQKEDKRTDYVFENEDGRILLANSFCNEFQDRPLEDLAQLTFKSVGSFEKGQGKYTTLQDREAYRLEGKGSVDGVAVDLKLLNTRRNNCYFDFVGIIPKKDFANPKGEEDFQNFLNSMVFE